MASKKEAGTKVLASQLSLDYRARPQWLSGLYYADFISFYSPSQLCGGGTTKSNSNELPISVPLSSGLLSQINSLGNLFDQNSSDNQGSKFTQTSCQPIQEEWCFV